MNEYSGGIWDNLDELEYRIKTRKDWPKEVSLFLGSHQDGVKIGISVSSGISVVKHLTLEIPSVIHVPDGNPYGRSYCTYPNMGLNLRYKPPPEKLSYGTDFGTCLKKQLKQLDWVGLLRKGLKEVENEVSPEKRREIVDARKYIEGLAKAAVISVKAIERHYKLSSRKSGVLHE